MQDVGGKAENPDPGSVLDTTVTKKGKNHSFYLVPQSVRNATCTPVTITPHNGQFINMNSIDVIIPYKIP